MSSLTVITRNGALVVDSRIIAEQLHVDHRVFIRTLRKHLTKLEAKLGRVCFENAPFETAGGVQQHAIAYLTEAQATAAATLSRNTDEVVDFKIGLAAAFDAARKRGTLAFEPVIELGLHTRREVQVQQSKEVNAFQWHHGGVAAIQDYNRENCRLHTGKEPSELKAWAKTNKLPSKHRGSGKDVVRYVRPDLAAAMSHTDNMVKLGMPHDQAAKLSVQHAAPLFKAMLAHGIIPAELEGGRRAA